MKTMTKQKLIDYVLEEYGISPDFPFAKDLECVVFRHKSNNKWFALLMNVTGDKLGLETKEKTFVLNVKCHPFMKGSLLEKVGIYEAYHMNKVHWISLNLGEVSDEDLFALLDISFEMTKYKSKKTAF